MKILRTLTISVMLATTGVTVPRYSFAQQSADSAQETTGEDTAVSTERDFGGQRNVDRGYSDDSEATEGGSSVNVQIVATYDERTNSVVVRGPGEILDLVAQVLADLDSTTTQIADVRIFKLRYTDATTTANIINQIFGEQQASQSNQRGGFTGPMMFRGPGGRGQTDPQDGSQTTVTAAADTQTNSIVVSGPENLLNVVEDVIKALDKRDTEAADVRVFQLRYADAMNTAQMINDLFGDDAQSSGSQGGMNFMRGGPGGMMGSGGRSGQGSQQQETSSLLTVSAAADSQTNSVVVTGPAEMLDVVAQMIKNVDTQIATLADVKVYHLEYADAQDTAELINEVFGESSSSSRTTSSSGQQNQAISFRGGGMTGRGGQQQATGTGGSIADVPIIASADSRTNSVVVSGAAETLAIITDVVKELDENPEQERQIFLYPLKNANATNLMTILNSLFAEMAALNDEATGTTGQQFQGNQRATQPTGGGATGDSSSDSDDLSEDTYLEADVDTNTLLVMTSSKNYEKIKPILEDLDKPIGQVLIKVLFAEVTHSDSIDLGTEFSMLNLSKGGDSVHTSQVFGTPSPLTYQGGATGFPTGLGVRTIEGDLDLTIHALQETGRLNVLSRPYILTSNNQLATITVGEEVPIATGTTEVAGQSQTTIDYRDDIGIVLNVTPSINPDGLVNMTVNPRITTRSAESVAITETLSAEAFSTRSAETKVSVRNGQTIVIGGLIEDKLTDTIKKIPILGDIPLAGHLFKRTIKEKTKTELLIFLTPHVAQEASGLTPISEAERERSILNTDKTAAEIFKKHMDAMKPAEADADQP